MEMVDLKGFKPCPMCSKSGNPGLIKDKHNNVRECGCLKAYNKYVSLMKYLISVNVPVKYIHYSIDEYIGKDKNGNLVKIKAIIDKLQEFVKEGLQLYLTGVSKSQKTSIACYILKKAAMTGNQCFYITMPHLINLLKDINFNPKIRDDHPEYDKYNQILQSDLLIIDDAFDSKKVYMGKLNYSSIFLNNFLEERLHRNKAQIYVSPVKRSDIPSVFGSRVLEYLNEECFELEFKDVIPRTNRNEKITKIISQQIKRGKPA
jgi:DNA replication protein DnaC